MHSLHKLSQLLADASQPANTDGFPASVRHKSRKSVFVRKLFRCVSRSESCLLTEEQNKSQKQFPQSKTIIAATLNTTLTKLTKAAIYVNTPPVFTGLGPDGRPEPCTGVLRRNPIENRAHQFLVDKNLVPE